MARKGSPDGADRMVSAASPAPTASRELRANLVHKAHAANRVHRASRVPKDLRAPVETKALAVNRGRPAPCRRSIS